MGNVSWKGCAASLVATLAIVFCVNYSTQENSDPIVVNHSGSELASPLDLKMAKSNDGNSDDSKNLLGKNDLGTPIVIHPPDAPTDGFEFEKKIKYDSYAMQSLGLHPIGNMAFSHDSDWVLLKSDGEHALAKEYIAELRSELSNHTVGATIDFGEADGYQAFMWVVPTVATHSMEGNVSVSASESTPFQSIARIFSFYRTQSVLMDVFSEPAGVGKDDHSLASTNLEFLLNTGESAIEATWHSEDTTGEIAAHTNPDAQLIALSAASFAHVVEKDETLWGIAKKFTGNPTNWQDLALLNGMTIDAANNIGEGQLVYVPTTESILKASAVQKICSPSGPQC